MVGTFELWVWEHPSLSEKKSEQNKNEQNKNCVSQWNKNWWALLDFGYWGLLSLSAKTPEQNKNKQNKNYVTQQTKNQWNKIGRDLWMVGASRLSEKGHSRTKMSGTKIEWSSRRKISGIKIGCDLQTLDGEDPPV